ncbi:CapA family protein [Bacillus sp. JJ664]
MKKLLLMSTLLLFILIYIKKEYFSNEPIPNHAIHKEKEIQKVPTTEQKPENEKPIVSKATIGAIGDILIHNEVYEDAKQKDGSYNFHQMFKEVRATMQKPDILVANQETMIGGEKIGLSTYPTFNSPYEVGDALKAAGVDVVTLANNHSLDRGEVAIKSAISHWDHIHMPYTGAYKSKADHDKIRTLTKNNIRFAFLSYTYGTNGIPVPKGKDYLVNLIDMKKIRQDVQRADAISDVVVVSMHWGKEYERLPNQFQKELAKQLADIGVQIVIGNHTHVLQPPAWVTGKTGNKAFVLYSLGNFLSAQDELYELIGGIASIDVVKTKYKDVEKIELTNPSFTPTYNYYYKNQNFKILPLQNISESYLVYGEGRYKNIKSHMRTYIKDLHFVEPVHN